MTRILERMLGADEFKENLRKRVDEFLAITQQMIEIDKSLINAIKEHTRTLKELRLTLKELQEKL